jgi:hypothetical protein
MALERGAGTEGDHRHARLPAKLHDLNHLIGGLRE